MKPNELTYRDTDACPSDELLQAYAHGRLSPATVAAIESHLSRCEHSRAALEELRQGDHLGALLREAREELNIELRERIIERASGVFSIRPKPERRPS